MIVEISSLIMTLDWTLIYNKLITHVFVLSPLTFYVQTIEQRIYLQCFMNEGKYMKGDKLSKRLFYYRLRIDG